MLGRFKLLGLICVSKFSGSTISKIFGVRWLLKFGSQAKSKVVRPWRLHDFSWEMLLENLCFKILRVIWYWSSHHVNQTIESCHVSSEYTYENCVVYEFQKLKKSRFQNWPGTSQHTYFLWWPTSTDSVGIYFSSHHVSQPKYFSDMFESCRVSSESTWSMSFGFWVSGFGF